VSKEKVIVVMPAYNAAKTLREAYESIPRHIVDKVILVDDVSQDETVVIARGLDIKTVVHSTNRGYGGNQKTCYMRALDEEADFIVMLHPDGQYDPKMIPQLLEPLKRRQADVVLGSRMLIKGGALKGGMPLYKYMANRLLTFLENLVLGLGLSEFHTGYRAYTRRFIETIPFLQNSNDFVFDTEIIAQAAVFNFKIAEVPIMTRYFNEASSVDFKVGLVYGLKTVLTLGKYLLHRFGLVKCKLFISQNI